MLTYSQRSQNLRIANGHKIYLTIEEEEEILTVANNHKTYLTIAKLI